MLGPVPVPYFMGQEQGTLRGLWVFKITECQQSEPNTIPTSHNRVCSPLTPAFGLTFVSPSSASPQTQFQSLFHGPLPQCGRQQTPVFLLQEGLVPRTDSLGKTTVFTINPWSKHTTPGIRLPHLSSGEPGVPMQ